MHLLIWLYTKSHRPCRRRNLSRGIWAKPKWWNRRRPNISHHLGASFCFPTAMLTAWRGNIDSMRQHTGEMVPFPCYRQRLLLQSSVQTVFSSRTANTTIFYTAIRLTDVAPSGPQSELLPVLLQVRIIFTSCNVHVIRQDWAPEVDVQLSEWKI